MVVLICTVNGQCTQDCACVPRETSSNVENRCCLSVSENEPPGTVVGSANDLELVANANPAQYELQGTHSFLFNINASTGIITTADSIDRERLPVGIDNDCAPLALVAKDSDGSPSDISVLPLFGIVILDANDNRPQFQIDHLNISVEENSGPGGLDCRSTPLNDVQANDDDIGINGLVTYKVAEGTPGSHLFRVSDPSRPCVENLVEMDRENTSVSYSFVLVAMDGGSPTLTSNITVEFNLKDINDNAPVFLNASGPENPISVREDAGVGTIVGRFIAIDMDILVQELTYGLTTTMVPFMINSSTGELELTATVDAELRTMPYDLVVTATDNQHTTMLNVRVVVTDVNEQGNIVPPQLPNELVEETINKANRSEFLFSIRVIDNDVTPENQVNDIEIVSGSEYFRAEKKKVGFDTVFTILQNQTIDRENITNGIVELSLLVLERGDPLIKVPFEHNFTITDINDNRPYLTNMLHPITETNGTVQDTGANVVQLNNNVVRDDDEGVNGMIVSFILESVMSSKRGDVTPDFITSNALQGDSREILQGKLHLPSILDREEYGSVLTIKMTFTDGGTPPMNRTASFMIEILDVNDNSPYFMPAEYTFTPMENRDPSEEIGRVTAEDADDDTTVNGQVVYSLERRGDFEYFSVDRQDGIITSNNTFDREEKDTFVIYVMARDKADPPRVANASAQVTILIQDQDDEPPEFEMDKYEFDVDATENPGEFVGNVKAVDRDVNITSNAIFYKFQYPTRYFKIDNSSGTITLQSVVSIADSPYNLTVVAYNPGGEELGGTAAVMVEVTQSALIVIYASIGGVVGFLVLAILILCCFICCLCRKSRNSGKMETDSANLNNTKPILKTLPATNGQQRSVKFNTTVEETHYDPSGIAEDSVIRKESNFGSGDESPQTSLRITMPNGMNGVHEPERIMDYEMSPSMIGNGDLPHQRPPYTARHGRMPSPIMLQEELNPSEYSQSTLSAMDDRNTYNSEGEEVESTYSDAPSNYNTSIPRFGRQTIQVEDHRHPGSVGHYGGHPPTHQSLDLHLPPVQHSSPGQFVELRAHNLARHEAQFASSSHPPPQGVGVPTADDIRELSLGSLPRSIGQHHHHHGSIGSSHGSTPPQRHIQRPLPPTSIHQPPVSITHSMVTPSSNGHTNTRNYPHPLVMPEAFPSTRPHPPTGVHRFDSFIPSFTDYGETSTYASTELNEALEFKYEAEPDFCSLTATDYGENDTEL